MAALRLYLELTHGLHPLKGNHYNYEYIQRFISKGTQAKSEWADYAAVQV